jgi:hypothetical protein
MDFFAWNNAIAKRFFNPASNGKRVVLNVTEAVLKEVASGSDLDLQDFLREIRIGPSWATETNICEKALRCFTNWRRGGFEFPPYIAYLGLFVLAAGIDGTFAPNAYYPRLRALLGEGGEGAYPGYERMRMLWQDLETWSVRDIKGLQGVFRAPIPRHFIHVGIPIAQVILSEHERALLPSLFVEGGLSPDSVPSDLLMRQSLVRHGANRLRTRTLTALRAPDLNSLEGQLIVSEALEELEQWDGSTPEIGPIKAQQGGTIRIWLTEIDEIGGRISARLQCRFKFYPEDDFILVGQDDEYRCDELADGWSTPLCHSDDGVDADAAQIDWSSPFCLSVKGTQRRFQLPPSDARVFVSAGDEMAGFVEVQRLVRDQKTIIIACQSAVQSIRTWGREDCAGFCEMDIRKGLPFGWHAFSVDKVLDDSSVRSRFPQLSFGTLAQIQVFGGIRDEQGRYFQFALPTVRYVAPSPSAQLVVNGFPVRTANREIPLPSRPGPSLEYELQIKDADECLRRRTIYVRAPEQPTLYRSVWVDRFGIEVRDSVSERASGGQVLCPNLPILDLSSHEPEPTPTSKAPGQQIDTNRIVMMLRAWKKEVSSTTSTGFASELAQLPGGKNLSEGALQYIKGVAIARQGQVDRAQRIFNRAVGEFTKARGSTSPVVSTIAYIYLHLIARRTEHSSPSPGSIPDDARLIVNMICRDQIREGAVVVVPRISMSDICLVEDDQLITTAL